VAVYTEVSDEALRAFLGAYELGALVAYRGIAEGVENSNYALKTERGDYILTLYEKRTRREELPYFLGLMRHLAAHGLSCPEPVAARDGEALRELAGRPAAICTFLPGVWPFCGVRENGLGPAAWAPLLDGSRASGDSVQPGLVAELDAQLDAILRTWPEGLPRGHIHADLFPDNVFFLQDGGPPHVSGLIDFYFACTDLLAYDLAVCLNAWCFEPDHSFNVIKARALIYAYDAARPLSAAERDALPVLCRGAAIRFCLTRLYDWTHTPAGALVTRKDPLEYLRKLRFFAACSGPSGLGL
jgi:homoserine kinase type II